MALNHIVKGSVNYTVVGSPIMLNGVASGFENATNYLTIGTVMPFATANNWEIKTAFRLEGTPEATIAQIFDFTDANNGVSLYYRKDIEKIFVGIGDGTNTILSDYSYTPQLNTWYFVKISFNGIEYKYEISTDNNNWQTVKTVTSSVKTANTTAYYQSIGVSRRYSSERAFPGGIDLNSTYIMVNGAAWFGNCPVEVQKHQLKGPVGYTVVGSPSIVDGIASGFSSSNYLTVGTANPSGIEYYKTNFEIATKATTPSTMQDGMLVYYPYRGIECGLRITTSGRIIWYLGTGNSSNPFYIESSVGTLSANETFYTKGTIINNTATLYKSSDGITWTTIGTLDITNVVQGTSDETARIGITGGSSPYYPFTGSIDLNHTYIKVNGELWFYQPADTKYIVKDGKLVWADPRIYTLNTQNGGGNAGYSVCFNAGFIPTNKTTYEISFDRLHSTDGSSEINASPFLITSAKYDETSYKEFGMNLQNQVAVSYFGQKKVAAVSYAELFNGVKKVLKSTLTGNGYNVTITQNGIVLDTLSFDIVEDQTCFGNLYLGCWNYGYSDGRTPPVRFYPFLGKIYYAKFWENGVLIRHFVPIVQGSVIGNFTVPSNGMFDIVNQQFYANKGTGVFAIGRDE